MPILQFIQEHMRNPVLDDILVFITTLSDGGAVWIILAALLLIFPKTRRAGAAMAVSLAIEFTLCDLIIKPIVARPRPCDVDPSVALLISRQNSWSFPSGHTGAAFSGAVSLTLSRSKLWPAALLLAVVTGFSRLYPFVHYPTDVLAGALLGVISAFAGKLVSEKLLLPQRE